MKHPGRAYLRSATPGLWVEFTDYMLGEHVRGLHAVDHGGSVVSRPAWAQILAYDLNVRKEMAKRLNNGHTFEQALRGAWQDTGVRDRYFVTPLALAGAVTRERPRRSRSPRRRSKPARKADQGRPTGKGAGKGRGKNKSARLAAKTPDGRNICFAYNNSAEGCTKRCGMVHVCRKCFGPHPMFQCRQDGGGASGGGAEKPEA